MIKRHERTQLFRELPRDCCSSLVTSLSEQKKSPVLQGDRQLLGSVRESLIAAGGGSHALMCAVTLRGGAGEKATLTISVPKALGPAAKPSTQVASLSLFTVPWGFFFHHKLQLPLQQDRAQLGFFAGLWSNPDCHREPSATRAASNLQGWAGSWPNRKSHVSSGSAASPEDEKCLTGHKCNFA